MFLLIIFCVVIPHHALFSAGPRHDSKPYIRPEQCHPLQQVSRLVVSHFLFRLLFCSELFFMPFDGHVRIRNEANYLILNRFLSKFMVRPNPGMGHKLTTSSFEDHLSPRLLGCLVPRSVRLVID